MAAKNKNKAGNWQKGQSGNPAGRRPGVGNKVTREAKIVCNGLTDDPTYLKNLKARMRDGTVAAAVECLVWYYAKGKPKERVELGADKSLASLITEAVLSASRQSEDDDAGE